MPPDVPGGEERAAGLDGVMSSLGSAIGDELEADGISAADWLGWMQERMEKGRPSA